MKLVVFLVMSMMLCVFGGFNIGCAVEYLTTKQNFKFGLSVMYALSSVVLMFDLVFKFFGGV